MGLDGSLRRRGIKVDGASSEGRIPDFWNGFEVRGVGLPISGGFKLNGTSGADTDTYGGGLAGGDVAGDIEATEQAAALAVVSDAGVLALLSVSGAGAGYTANYQLFPDSEAINDAVYFGAAKPFFELYFNMSATVQVNAADTAIWEYWNGTAWATLTVYDTSSATKTTGAQPFEQDGTVSFLPPSAWAATTVNSTSAYWVRCRLTAAQITTLGLTASVEHAVVELVEAPKAVETGTITGLHILDDAATLHTANDIEFALVNFTTGTHSGLLDFAQDIRQENFTGLTMLVARGDALGILILAEDGTNEAGPIHISYDMTRTP